VPEAVSKHDVVRGLSELSNVALGRAQETGGVKKLAAAFPGLFLSPFPPLGGDVDAFVDL
jgi:hypothetical protein